ncbi:MAG: ChbG/HpnK family deacetylase [Chloroflexota bacterium]
MKQLIVNADDYGATPGVSRGILEAHHKGIVTSTSVMIGCANAVEAVHEALHTAPDLGLGLHFTLSGTGLRPILPPDEVRSLVQADGTFYPIKTWLAHYADFDPSEIEREMAAQCECFIDVAEQQPDHLDGHHHAVYRHPASLLTLFNLADHYRIPIRNPGFDGTLDTQHKLLNDLLNDLPDAVRDSSIAAVSAILAERRVLWPDRFEGNFYDATATLGDLLLMLTNLPDGMSELMCHPGYVDEYLHSDYTTKREDEIAALTHASVREVVKSEEIALVKFNAVTTP